MRLRSGAFCFVDNGFLRHDRGFIHRLDNHIGVKLQITARDGDDNIVDTVVATGFAQHAQILVKVAVG